MNIAPFNTIGKEEEEAVLRVIRSGKLSGYVALKEGGGAEVSALEYEFGHCFGTMATAVNSATSGLLAACMAASVAPGHEVIVSPLTMSATFAVPAVLGAKIVFCDTEPDTFNMDVMKASSLITENTRAIIVPNMFGCPADLHFLRALCDSHNIIMIEDNAQSIMARENGVYAGTIGHMGVFSFNVHKHMQCGEGGMVVTADADLDTAIRWAMNHGEMRNGAFGLNLRMTEITAAIAREQLKKLPGIVKRRQEIGERFTDNVYKHHLDDLLAPQRVKQGKEPVYYAWAALNKEYDRSPWAMRVCNAQMLPFSNRYNCLIPDNGTVPIAFSTADRLFISETCAIDPTDEEIDEIFEKLASMTRTVT